jgi:hypothetical protein
VSTALDFSPAADNLDPQIAISRLTAVAGLPLMIHALGNGARTLDDAVGDPGVHERLSAAGRDGRS